MRGIRGPIEKPATCPTFTGGSGLEQGLCYVSKELRLFLLAERFLTALMRSPADQTNSKAADSCFLHGRRQYLRSAAALPWHPRPPLRAKPQGACRGQHWPYDAGRHNRRPCGATKGPRQADQSPAGGEIRSQNMSSLPRRLTVATVS